MSLSVASMASTSRLTSAPAVSKRTQRVQLVTRAQADNTTALQGVKRAGVSLLAGLAATSAFMGPVTGLAYADQEPGTFDTTKNNLDLGPNEVTQEQIKTLPFASKYDQAAPGRVGTIFQGPKDDASGGGAVNAPDLKEKASKPVKDAINNVGEKTGWLQKLFSR